MAAKVNVRFVVILSVVLVAVMAGVVYAALTVVMKSGEDYARSAQQFETEGNYRAAKAAWERAVGHDRTRLDWLTGLRQSLEKKQQDSIAEYLTDRRQHLNVLGVIAEVKGPDLAAHREFLEELTYGFQIGGINAAQYTAVSGDIERSIQTFPDSMTAERGQIRRYRGILGAFAMAGGVTLDDDEIEGLREDLLAAIEGDPGDAQAISSLVQIGALQAAEAERDRRPEEADRIWEGLAETIDGFIAGNPGSIRARVQRANVDLGQAINRVVNLGLFGADQREAQIAARQEVSETARSLAAEYLTADGDRADEVNFRTANEITVLLQQSATENASDLIADIWAHTVASRPDDAIALQYQGVLLRQISRYDDAIGAFAAIRELPRPPVSAAGTVLIELKRAAAVQMGFCAYDKWYLRTANAEALPAGSTERASLTVSAGEALDAARTYRDQASTDLAEDNTDLLLLNARIAFAEGSTATADRLARRFNEATGERQAEGLRLAADIGRRLGNIGEQERLLTRLIGVAPNDVRSMLELAEIKTTLREYAEAEQLLSRARDLRPDLAAIEDRLSVLRALLGETESDDPLEAARIDAQLASDRGDIDEAVAIIERAIAENPEGDLLAMYGALANIELRRGNSEAANAAANAGLEIDPGSRVLQMIVRQTEVGNDVQAADAMIDSLETLTEGQKSLRKHRLRVALGQLDEAAPFLDAARETEGDTPAFLLAAFEYALATNDLDEARAIIAQSADRDIDGADGLTLRARLNIAEGSLDEAERALATAVERGSLNPTTFGLLGRVRSLQGDAAGAIDAFGRAREIRPDSVEHIVNYCRALAAAGRQTDALEAARSSLDVARTSPEFRQIWLALEGTVGSKQTAYDERVAVAEAEPDNEDNTAALIQLCIDLGRFDEARDRLDAARAERDTLTLCRLDALWHTQRGDLQAASQQYQQFLISDAEGANSASAYIAFGTFLIDYGQLDAGLTTLRQGRRVQPADNPIVDRVLATRLFQAGRYQQAVEVLGPLVDAEDQGGDERVRSLLIESLVRLDQWDAAETRIAQLPEDEQELLVTRLLRVEIARGRGNDAEARRILDEAIAAFPDEALPYVRRATLLMADEALLSDAAEDLTRAIELDPTSVEALRFRSVVLNRLGREDQAIEDIIAASRARPLDDQTRFAAATRLTELGREDLAADLVDEGLELQPGNLRLLMNGGRLFASRDNHRRAVQYLERAWEQSKDVNVASPLVNSMLEMPRPNLRAARQVVTDPQLDQESPAVLLLQARIESAAEDMRATESLLTEIYLSSRNDPQVLVGWGAALSELLGGDAEAAAYLRRLDARETLSPWGRFTQARTLSADESGTSEALDIVTSLVESPPDANLGLAALRLRSIIHYNAEDYESAAADMRRGLEIVPDDAELHNNLAYTLSEHMDKPAEALPLAVRAVELSPMNRGMLDTLGTVYISAGQPENAFEPLERALALATTDAGRVSAMVLLARAQLETGNLPGASDTASDARRIIDRIDEPDEDTQRELDSVLEDIQQRR